MNGNPSHAAASAAHFFARALRLTLAGCYLLTVGAFATAGADFSPGPCPVDLGDPDFTIDCGVLQVPETRGADNGRNVALPVVRVNASAEEAMPDPVIYLHGGPGGGVMDELKDRLADERWRELMGGTRDWIFFDQRGGGLAHPLLDCGQLGLSDTGFTSDAAVVSAAACAQRLVAAGVDLGQYNVETTVADLVDLVNALGYERFNLYALSYGSRVAFAAQQYAPEHIRAVVHDSPYPPEARGTELLPMLLAREVRQALALCATDEACNTAYPGLEARLDAELKDWLAAPRQHDGRAITASDLASFLLDAIYEWDGIRQLPGDIDTILGGDLSPITAYLDAGGDFAEGQLLAHFCKEELPFEDAESMARLAQGDLLAEAALANAQRLFRACADWPVGAPNPREAEPVKSDIPTLLIAAEIDAGCPTDFSEAAIRSLSAGQYTAVPNAVHDMTSNSDCVMRMVKRFIDQPGAAIRTDCLAVEHAVLPFDLPR
jgi:pimeloyl-ACP methyl ester carboxylesterase